MSKVVITYDTDGPELSVTVDGAELTDVVSIYINNPHETSEYNRPAIEICQCIESEDEKGLMTHTRLSAVGSSNLTRNILESDAYSYLGFVEKVPEQRLKDAVNMLFAKQSKLFTDKDIKQFNGASIINKRAK